MERVTRCRALPPGRFEAGLDMSATRTVLRILNARFSDTVRSGTAGRGSRVDYPDVSHSTLELGSSIAVHLLDFFIWSFEVLNRFARFFTGTSAPW